jgi:hypothetical protein
VPRQKDRGDLRQLPLNLLKYPSSLHQTRSERTAASSSTPRAAPFARASTSEAKLIIDQRYEQRTFKPKGNRLAGVQGSADVSSKS